MWSEDPDFLEKAFSRSRKRSSPEERYRRLCNESKTTAARLNYLTRYVIHLRDQLSSVKEVVTTLQNSQAFRNQEFITPHPSSMAGTGQQAFLIPPATAATSVIMMPSNPMAIERSCSVGLQHPEPQADNESVVSSLSEDDSHVDLDGSFSIQSPQKSPTPRIRSKPRREHSPVHFRIPEPVTPLPASHRKRRRSYVVPAALRRRPSKANSSNSSVSDSDPVQYSGRKKFGRR